MHGHLALPAPPAPVAVGGKLLSFGSLDFALLGTGVDGQETPNSLADTPFASPVRVCRAWTWTQGNREGDGEWAER